MPDKPTRTEIVVDPPATEEQVDLFRRAMKTLSGKWKIEILWHLSFRKRRFGELRRCLPGITQHMLTRRLRELEEDGLITRTVFPEVPPRVEYELSQATVEFSTMFEAMMAWAAANLDESPGSNK